MASMLDRHGFFSDEQTYKQKTTVSLLKKICLNVISISLHRFYHLSNMEVKHTRWQFYSLYTFLLDESQLTL